MNIIKNFFRPFYDNIFSILVSLAFALIVWFSISLQIFPDITESVTDIPVQIKPSELMINENLQIADAENYGNLVASAQIHGKRYEIGTLTAEDFEAYMDFSEVTTEGEHEIPIVVRAKDDSTYEVLPANRSQTVEIERIEQKTLEVAVKTDGLSVVEGLQIDETGVFANPQTVTITGEKKLIDSIDRAEINALSDNVLSKTTELKGAITFYKPGNVLLENPDISTDNSEFTVTVPIHKVKTLNLTFRIDNAPSNFNLKGLQEKMTIRPSTLTISSPDNSIDAVTELEIGSKRLEEIDFSYISSLSKFTVEQFLPEGYRNVSNQSACTMEFREMENYSWLPITLTSDSFNILNKPAMYDVEFLTREITLDVIGPANFIRALSPEDISLTVNLLGSEIAEGVKTIQATYRINGENIPAWVVGVPKLDLSFSVKQLDEQNVD